MSGRAGIGPLQAQLGQRVIEPALGDFNLGPAQLIGRIACVGQPFRLAARDAQRMRVGSLDRKIAQTDIVAVCTGAVAGMPPASEG